MTMKSTGEISIATPLRRDFGSSRHDTGGNKVSRRSLSIAPAGEAGPTTPP
ncbi:unnamed protein product, partial [Laminaria digitata]